jgi:hypothetical protein
VLLLGMVWAGYRLELQQHQQGVLEGCGIGALNQICLSTIQCHRWSPRCILQCLLMIRMGLMLSLEQ